MNRDQKLTSVLVEFAHTLSMEHSIETILDRLVLRVVDVLPVTGAGVVIIGKHDALQFSTSSDAVIQELERLQNSFVDGPCLEAYRTGEQVLVPDLSTDDRFPRFSPGAAAAGMAAVFTFPMRHDGAQLGALDLYRDTPGGLSSGDLRVAQVLADVAAAYLSSARSKEATADHLAQLRHRTLHDPLTGLPNRTLLGELLERALARARRTQRPTAVLFLDLDHFKQVNDQFGHHVGDLLLTAVAARLGSALRPGDILARLAGDEFVIVCEELTATAQAELVADRMSQALTVPFVLAGHEIRISASIGVALSQPGEDLPTSVLQQADSAMYQAKAARDAPAQVVARTGRKASRRHAALERDLTAALCAEQLLIAYQPIVRAGDESLVGVESLLRWQHPDLGAVPPDVIIPSAERSGLIVPLGEWVLHRACTDFVRWQHAFHDAPRYLSVNVSAHQIVEPGFARAVGRTLAATGMDPSQLHLEVTETVLLEDAIRAHAAMSEVKAMGVEFSLDDFGVGYSCLSYLRLFPFDDVKIDGSFVRGMSSADPANQTIVAAIIDLGRALGLRVVVEGVETQQQLSRVIDLGAEFVQGFRTGRPLFPPDLERLVLSGSSA